MRILHVDKCNIIESTDIFTQMCSTHFAKGETTTQCGKIGHLTNGAGAIGYP